MLAELGTVCTDIHAVLGDESAGGFNDAPIRFHHAKPTATEGGKTLAVAQMRYIYVVVQSDLEYIGRIVELTA